MMFVVEYSNQALKFLERADKVLGKRLLKKIEGLREQPISHDTKRIEGFYEKLFRVRVGDYRILYEVDYKANKIGIVKIDKRAKVY